LRPGLLILLGSGETSTVGGQVFDALAQLNPTSMVISILETPAGFELNSAKVAGKIKDFLLNHLQNYHPEINIIPAKKKNTPFSPDSAELVAPLLAADFIFLGPGSPTYAVRQLKDSLVWNIIQARFRMGTPLVMASAAAIASGRKALPVYEIFKVGEDPHWKDGLDLTGYLGLHLVVIPHWNNTEGGADLDTSRCFMGEERFNLLNAQLDPALTVLGIDENTAVLVDFNHETCRVIGREGVHIFRGKDEWHLTRGENFPISILGNITWTEPSAGIPPQVWESINKANQARQATDHQATEVPVQVQDLVTKRQEARLMSNWSQADLLRQKVQELGWNVIDTQDGPVIQQKSLVYPARVPRTKSPTNQ
jgi:peptidase E